MVPSKAPESVRKGHFVGSEYKYLTKHKNGYNRLKTGVIEI